MTLGGVKPWRGHIARRSCNDRLMTTRAKRECYQTAGPTDEDALHCRLMHAADLGISARRQLRACFLAFLVYDRLRVAINWARVRGLHAECRSFVVAWLYARYCYMLALTVLPRLLSPMFQPAVVRWRPPLER